jgi:hypothetical protein
MTTMEVCMTNLTQRTFRTSIISFVSIIFIATFSACGGGGGGGGGGEVTYTGVTTQAVITSGNSDDLTVGSLQNGTISESSSAVAVVAQDTGAGGRPRGLIVADAVRNVLVQVDVPSKTANATAVGATISENGSISGNCGGSASFTLTLDDVTGTFNGNFTYSNFCYDDITLTGSATISGVIDLFDLDFVSISIETNGLTTQLCGESFTVAGRIVVTGSSPTIVVDVDTRVRDDATGTVYWVNDLRIISTDNGGGYIDVTVAGRFYDPNFGFAVVTTTTPLRIFYFDAWPDSGVLLATGDLGVGGGSTKARLSAFGSVYTVEADTTGDGLFDFSVIKTWPENLCDI